MLEKMDKFFERRLATYDEHMLNDIEYANTFYPFTAGCLPLSKGVKILDLGCGTGLELEEYFKLNQDANVVGIDLSAGMLEALKSKFPDKKNSIQLICGSYFDVELGTGIYDAAVSVESLHHFTKEEKSSLYKKLCASLKEGGYFILTDYFAKDNEYEQFHREELLRLKSEEGISDSDFYHYDTPLTVEHETEALLYGGFKSVRILDSWGATFTLRADK